MALSRKKIKQAKRLYPEKSLEEIASLLSVEVRELAQALREEGLKVEELNLSKSVQFPFGRGNWLILLLLAWAVLLVYANSYKNVFHYDDYHSLTENIHIRKLSNIPKFFTDPQTFSSKVAVKMVRPILLTTFALNYAWTQYKPWSWILVNILIHLGNVLLVYVMVVHFFGKQKLAVLTALIFALHPVNTETVNYINCRSSLLVSSFMLLSVYGFARAIFRKSWLWQVISVIAFGLGLLVKEEAIVVIALVLVLDALYLWPRTRGELFNRVLAHYVPYLGLIIIYFLYRQWALNYWIQEVQPRPVFINLLIQSRCLVHYLNLLLIPIHQNTSYENIEFVRWVEGKIFPTGLNIVLPSILYLLIWLGAGIYFRKKFPVFLFFLLNFFITLAPTTVIPLNAIMNEHRLYLPSLGLALLLSAIVTKLEEMLWDWRKNLVSVSLSLIFLCLSLLSIARNRVWISDMVLWRDAIKKSPTKAQVISDLGNAYFRRNPPDIHRAEQLYLWAIRVEPTYFKAHHNLAIVNFRRGDEIGQKDPEQAKQLYRTAIRYFEQAIAIYPINPDSWNDMGTAYFKLREFDRAEKCYRKAIEINPLNLKSYVSLSIIYALQNRYLEAEEALKTALRIYDKDPPIWFGLAELQAKLGKYDEALESAQRGLEIDPTNPLWQKEYQKIYEKIQKQKAGSSSLP